MNRIRSGLSFILLGLLWGSSFVAIEAGLPYFPPIIFAALRYYVAGAAILVFAMITTEYWRPRSHQDWLVILIAGAFIIGGHHAFLYIGQQYISGTMAAIIISLGPILTMMFATLLLDESLTVRRIVGLILGFIGVTLIAGPADLLMITTSVLGSGLVFLAASAFALGSVLTRPYRTTMPVQSMQAWAMLLGAGLLHIVGVGTGEHLEAIQWTPSAVVSLAHLSLISGAVAFLLYFQLLDQHGPAEINLIGYFEPVAAALLSWVIFGRLVDLPTATGFIAIFGGFLLIKQKLVKQLIPIMRRM
ncbi:DMT family transporter [Saliphagus infecundisoli]|uniref:DMT family transporter n=1 Tax=Saliphagus infecundisoli TaxID=1849069 RepID=A0ABD5QLX8_9EURY|nr:DMT family transporter [Saliphagus infecundisoli]